MIHLTKDQIVTVHTELQALYGGKPGVRDDALLDAVLEAPYQSYHDQELFQTIPMKAARLCCGFVCEAPMMAGNARTGLHLMLIVLGLNDFRLHYTKAELHKLAESLTPSPYLYENVLTWILTCQLR